MFSEAQLISLRCQCQCLVTNHFQTRSNHILDLHLIFHILHLELRNPEGEKKKTRSTHQTVVGIVSAEDSLALCCWQEYVQTTNQCILQVTENERK